MAIIPGRMTRKGKNIFGTAATSGVRRAADHRFRRHGTLHDQKIGAPIAERKHEAETHDHGEPLHTHWILEALPMNFQELRKGAGREALRSRHGRETRLAVRSSHRRRAARERRAARSRRR